MHLNALPGGSLYRPGKFMSTGSLHGAGKKAPLTSNYHSVKFFCAASAQMVRMTLNLDVGANVSP